MTTCPHLGRLDRLDGLGCPACDLPPELAPTKRAAVEALLAECPPVANRPEPRRGHNPRPACVVCHKTTGKMGGHHVVPGDDASVVPVHRGCHHRLHAT